MRKKLSVLLLILALIMNQAAPMGIKAADAADEVKVYVENGEGSLTEGDGCLLYTSPSPRDTR